MSLKNDYSSDEEDLETSCDAHRVLSQAHLVAVKEVAVMPADSTVDNYSDVDVDDDDIRTTTPVKRIFQTPIKDDFESDERGHFISRRPRSGDCDTLTIIDIEDDDDVTTTSEASMSFNNSHRSNKELIELSVSPLSDVIHSRSHDLHRRRHPHHQKHSAGPSIYRMSLQTCSRRVSSSTTATTTAAATTTTTVSPVPVRTECSNVREYVDEDDLEVIELDDDRLKPVSHSIVAQQHDEHDDNNNNKLNTTTTTTHQLDSNKRRIISLQHQLHKQQQQIDDNCDLRDIMIRNEGIQTDCDDLFQYPHRHRQQQQQQQQQAPQWQHLFQQQQLQKQQKQQFHGNVGNYEGNMSSDSSEEEQRQLEMQDAEKCDRRPFVIAPTLTDRSAAVTGLAGNGDQTECSIPDVLGQICPAVQLHEDNEELQLMATDYNNADNTINTIHKEDPRGLEKMETLVGVEELLLVPAPPTKLVMLQVQRETHFVVDSFTSVMETITGQTGFFLAAKKRKKCAHLTYIISTDSTCMDRNSTSCVGCLRANLVGNQFTLYGPGLSPEKYKSRGRNDLTSLRQELAAIVYEPNPLGALGPRRQTLIIPGFDQSGKRIILQPQHAKDSLINRYNDERLEGLMIFHNRTPVWDYEKLSYVLNFYGRVSRASVKNFQIENKNNNSVILQFGRVDKDEFTLDYSYPLCGLQAFGVALSSFGCKMACG